MYILVECELCNSRRTNIAATADSPPMKNEISIATQGNQRKFESDDKVHQDLKESDCDTNFYPSLGDPDLILLSAREKP